MRKKTNVTKVENKDLKKGLFPLLKSIQELFLAKTLEIGIKIVLLNKIQLQFYVKTLTIKTIVP